MRFQFENHDYTVVIPDNLDKEFEGNDKLALLHSYLISAFPHFQNVPEGSRLVPVFNSSLMAINEHRISLLDLAIMEMMTKGMMMINETNMLLYLLIKIKDLDLRIPKNDAPEEKKSSLLL